MDFFHLDTTVLKITLGLIFLGIASGLTGVFAYIKNDSLSADAIAHSTLPGVCIGFMLAGTKNPYFLYGGALIFGILCQFLISIIDQNSKLQKDAITAIILTSLFALGTVLSDYIANNSSYTNKSGINSFLFGQAASTQSNDVYFIAAITGVIILGALIFGRSIKVLAFDSVQFSMYGWPKARIQFVFDLLLTLSVIIGIQTVGVVLMSALIITPAVCARSITNNFRLMVIVSILINIIYAIVGNYVSYKLESAIGPWVIMISSLLCFTALGYNQLKKQ